MTAAREVQTTFRRRTLFATAMAAVVVFGAARAFADPSLVDLQIIDRETGQPLPMWRHHGRLFVAGEPGRRYGLRVTNRTDARVMAVLSVDGVNIVSGQTASYDQRGYVFGPHQSHDVNGWRKSDTEIASFSFAPLPNSYAARTGRPSNVGVIGMAVFREMAPTHVEPLPAPPRPKEVAPYGSNRAYGPPTVPTIPPLPIPPVQHHIEEPVPTIPPLPIPPVEHHIEEPVPPSPAGDSGPARPEEKLGTAHGAREWSLVRTVDFKRATPYPQMVLQIQYDTYANLVLAGVVPARRADGHPQAFPRTPASSGFVPDPPPEY